MAEKDTMTKLRFEHNGQNLEVSISAELAGQLQSPDIDNGTKLCILEQIAASLGAGPTLSVNTSTVANDKDVPSTASNSLQPPQTASLTEKNTETPSKDSAIESGLKFWKVDEERALISVRTEMNSNFLSGSKDHTQLWRRVQEKLADLEINATATQIVNKWNQLKKRYKDVKDHNKKTGNNKKVFKFMEEFDNLYGEKASTSPQFTLESNTSSESGSEPTTANTSQNKTRKRPISHQDRQLLLMEEMLKVTKDLSEDAKEMQKARLERMDRFLDIFQSSIHTSKD